MTKALVLAELAEGHIGDTTRELVTAARGLGEDTVVTVAVLAAEPKPLVEELAVAGIDAVLTMSLPGEGFDAEQQQAAVAALMDEVEPDVVLTSYAIRSASFGGALAYQRDLGFVSDVVGLTADGETLLAVRPVYGGKVHAEIELRANRPSLLLARSGSFAPAGDGDVPTRVGEVPAPAGAGRVRHLSYQEPEEGVDLKRAEVILAIGRGVGGEENIPIFVDLAQQMGAMLGATRPVVDAGWLPAAHQVGQTGTTVKPKLYLAFGISGALQHLAGMSGAKTVVAVNTDASAPIFAVSDEGAVADIGEVAEALKARLS